ncbi:hypothetical protein QQ008_25670 [Fulvivirgaceae bacterium BMA10]|uniref:SecDF P1 head subdomain domain-containing protein n=1 Tax=Splendidivirga corallicola TaxID=3051826 RepID=A0ABT8KVK8_9BACT|nr:hypothetical protein [Fulvivirgaceae bacterium BMA10]
MDSVVNVLNRRFDLFYGDNVRARLERQHVSIDLAEKINIDTLMYLVNTNVSFGIWEVYESMSIFENLSTNKAEDSLFNFLSTSEIYNWAPAIGTVKPADTANLMKLLKSKYYKNIIPFDAKLKWGKFQKHKGVHPLYVIKKKSKKAPINPKMVSSVKLVHDEYGRNAILINLKKDYHHTWENLTKKNIGGHLAIVINDQVFTAPSVLAGIPNGTAQISGNLSANEAKILCVLLAHGSMPTKLEVTEIDPELTQ